MSDTLASLSDKLRIARQAIGLSTRVVAERLWTTLQVSHATIANYETGRTVPPISVLAVLADLYQRPLTWFLENGRTLEGVRYRALTSKLRVSDRHVFEGMSLKWLDAYQRLDTFLNLPLKAEIPLDTIPLGLQPRALAKWVRDQLQLGDMPVPSVVSVLQTFGIRVIELDSELAISGIAAKFGDEHVVVLNPRFPYDRCRMNAAHELGHILLGHCREDLMKADHRRFEQAAFEVASHFLIPEKKLREICRPKSMVTLVHDGKETYGVSLAAIIYAAERERIWDEKTCKWLWMQFSTRGWKVQEPGHVRPDRAIRFESNLDSAILRSKLTWDSAASVTHVRPEELRQRVQLALGIEDPMTPDREETEAVPARSAFRLVF